MRENKIQQLGNDLDSDGNFIGQKKDESQIVADNPYEDLEINENNRQAFLEREKLAIETGKTYAEVLDILLSSESTDKKERCFGLIKNMPPASRTLFEKGVNLVFDQINSNQDILKEHKDNEIGFLFDHVLSDLNIPETEANNVRSLVAESQLLEPTAGIPIIAIDRRLLRRVFYMAGQEIPPGQDVNFCAHGVSPKEPTFIVISKNTGEEYQIGKNQRQYDDLKHELNHFVWRQMEKSGFARKITGENTTEKEAFGRFRSESIAYLLMDGQSLFDKTSPEHLVSTDEPEILDKVELSQSIMSVLGRKLESISGTSRNALVYYIFSSRNFDECLDNLTKLNERINEINLGHNQ